MLDRPLRARDYTPELTELARSTCLYLATRLGDLMEEIVLVGGLAPSAGFRPATNEAGNVTRQKWRHEEAGEVTLDFLIPQVSADDAGGTLQNLEADLAAIVTPGLHLAFDDKEEIELSGRTLLGERATRVIGVCGPGAFVVLKALAFRLRGNEKDAYDLSWILRNYGGGVADVAARLRPLLDDANTRRALDILAEDFGSLDALGPRRVAAFLTGGVDDGIQADVVGFVGSLLEQIAG
jgi:hypothetical protein